MPSVKIFVICFLIYFITFWLFGFSANHIAEEIFGIFKNKLVITSGIFTISFVAGFVTPGSPAGIGVREAALIILLSPIYGELCAVGIATITRLAQMAGDCITMLLAVLFLRNGAEKNKLADESQPDKKPSIIYWGTYDLSKPRNPILLDGLTKAGCFVTECHESIWESNNDKSQFTGIARWVGIFLAHLKAYPRLIWRFMRLEKSNFVFVGYLGHIDIFFLWPFAKLKGIPIVWDAYISMYNTIVEDRQMVSRKSPVSYLVYLWEWLACRLADTVLVDTKAHADYFKEKYSLKKAKVTHALVGVENNFLEKKIVKTKRLQTDKPFSVLFYGTFIPLHGISTIIKAARLVQQDNVDWTIIGKGQESDQIERQLKEKPISNLTWIPWVEYSDLVNKINEADVCLGIFGNTQKSSMVIPNKVFQIIACGKPLITRDSPAIRELLSADMEGVWLIPPEDESALAKSVIEAIDRQEKLKGDHLYTEIQGKIQPEYIARSLIDSLVPTCTVSSIKKSTLS